MQIETCPSSRAIPRALLAAATAASLVAGCAGGGFESAPPDGPDLVARVAPELEVCRLAPDGKLLIRIGNAGTRAANSATRVSVLFAGGVPRLAAAPPLPAGGQADAAVEIPDGCFSPHCEYLVTVDVNNNVTESNEGNNDAEGICSNPGQA